MDRRVTRGERSKSALKSTFLKLILEKEPEDITVVELCQKAGVNRSTFYAHYNSMEQLIREVLLESVAKICVGMGPQWSFPLEDGGVSRALIASYLDRFLSDPTLRRFCTCANSGNYRTMIIRTQVELTLQTSHDPIQYYTAYYHNAGSLNIILEWVNNGMAISRDDVIEITHEFSKVMYRS